MTANKRYFKNAEGNGFYDIEKWSAGELREKLQAYVELSGEKIKGLGRMNKADMREHYSIIFAHDLVTDQEAADLAKLQDEWDDGENKVEEATNEISEEAAEQADEAIEEHEAKEEDDEYEVVRDISDYTGGDQAILEDMSMKNIKQIIKEWEESTGEKVLNKSQMTNEELREEVADIAHDWTVEVTRRKKVGKAVKQAVEAKEEGKTPDKGKRVEDMLKADDTLQGRIRDCKSKSAAIRMMHDEDYEVVDIFHILNHIDIPTRYQMVYQVVENYVTKKEEGNTEAAAE